MRPSGQRWIPTATYLMGSTRTPRIVSMKSTRGLWRPAELPPDLLLGFWVAGLPWGWGQGGGQVAPINPEEQALSVELRGFEPLASCMPCKRSAN